VLVPGRAALRRIDGHDPAVFRAERQAPGSEGAMEGSEEGVQGTHATRSHCLLERALLVFQSFLQEPVGQRLNSELPLALAERDSVPYCGR